MYQNGVLTMTGIGGPPPRPRAEPVPVCGTGGATDRANCCGRRARGPQRVSRGQEDSEGCCGPALGVHHSVDVCKADEPPVLDAHLHPQRAAPVNRLVGVEPLAAFASGESKALMPAHEVPAAFRSGARTRRRRRHNHQHLAARSCQLRFARPAMRRQVHAAELNMGVGLLRLRRGRASFIHSPLCGCLAAHTSNANEMARSSCFDGWQA